MYPVVASATALHVITASKAFGAIATSKGSGQAGRGVNINSQSKGVVSCHLSSHSIKYSCPPITLISSITDPKTFGVSQPSSSVSTGVNTSQPSV